MQVMEIRARLLDAEHPHMLTSMTNLALIYRNQERWKEAEELQIQVLETAKKVLGSEHPDTLTSIANLASIYRNQGRWKEAEELFILVMKTGQRVLGDEHPSTLTNMARLASTTQRRNRVKKDSHVANFSSALSYRLWFMSIVLLVARAIYRWACVFFLEIYSAGRG